MSAKIVLGFLAGALSATTGAYFAVRRIVTAPAPVINIVIKPPAPPLLTIPAALAVPTPVKTIALRKPEPESRPVFYLDPRPPASEPEPEPPALPVLSDPDAPIPAIALTVNFKLSPPGPHVVTIPEGSVIAVRLGEPLSTKNRRQGESFAATLDQRLVIDGFIIAEHGARVEGRIAEADEAGRVKGLARLALELTKINTADGQTILIRTTHFVKSGPESKVEDGAKIATGAALGAAIGAASAQGKGAAIGAAAGAAAGVAAVAMTRGKPAELAVEARLSFKLQDPVTITERLN
ncbi:MAG TPA: hypothetical protein VNX18_07460 [Bryobacteraceae bacterium]|nr:hypothetical protein [Bryobacteraceae bacterium]